MFQRILVAIDPSPISDRAFDSALSLAKATGASLAILHVLDIFDPDSPRQSLLPIEGFSRKVDAQIQRDYSQRWTEYVSQRETLLNQKRAIAQETGVPAEIFHAYGRPETVICNMAQTQRVDVILVGSRGRKGLNEMLLGSVSNYVMHHAPCSVMVVHPQVSQNLSPDIDDHMAKLVTAAM